MVNVDITVADLSVGHRKIEPTYSTQRPVSLDANAPVLTVAFISVDENSYLSAILADLELRRRDFRVGNPISRYGPLAFTSWVEAAGRDKFEKWPHVSGLLFSSNE